MNDQADIADIAACQQGDRKAFRRVFDIYRDRIYGLCRNLAGNAEDAEDLTQDVFISAFRNIGSFRAECAFGTWLYRIASNRCLSELRRRRPGTQSIEGLEELDLAPPSSRPGPDDVFARKELTRRIEAAVAALPENLKPYFVMGTLEGMRYREIGEILGCSEDAVKMRVHRARKRVRDTLMPYLET